MLPAVLFLFVLTGTVLAQDARLDAPQSAATDDQLPDKPVLSDPELQKKYVWATLGVEGQIQREGEVIHLVAQKLSDHTGLLGTLATASRDFH